MNKFYITTPIYYVNDKPHIGHAYTTIMADILARYYRFKLGKDNVYFLTGTDEHGAKVAKKAESEGKTPQDYADEISMKFREAWGALNISNNDFIRTTEERHLKSVEQVWLKLKAAKTPKGNEAIYQGKYEGLYCVGCEEYKKEEDLVDGKCPAHDKAPEFLSENNWYFRLSDYAEDLKSLVASDAISVKPVERKNEVISFIEGGLEDIAVSRQRLKWGVAIPFDDTQVTYVWVDALSNYISALGYPGGELMSKFWPSECQLLGKDILKFHALIWPAMLLAIGEKPPLELFIHGYFTINGKKMSKTLGNVIDPNDMVKDYGVDATRYLLSTQFPFGEDGDVKAEDFAMKYNSDLANGLGNLVSRVLGMTEKYCGNKIPDLKFTAEVALADIWKKLDANYAEYRIYENLQEIVSLIRWCDVYIAESKPWTMMKEDKQQETEQLLYNCLEIIRHLAMMIQPVMPATAEQILSKLGESDASMESAQKISAFKSGQTLIGGEGLFARREVKQ